MLPAHILTHLLRSLVPGQVGGLHVVVSKYLVTPCNPGAHRQVVFPLCGGGGETPLQVRSGRKTGGRQDILCLGSTGSVAWSTRVFLISSGTSLSRAATSLFKYILLSSPIFSSSRSFFWSSAFFPRVLFSEDISDLRLSFKRVDISLYHAVMDSFIWVSCTCFLFAKFTFLS